jgi:hypothetical protein
MHWAAVSKPSVCRWRERFMTAGVEAPFHDSPKAAIAALPKA